MPELKKAYAYARYSSDKQSPLSAVQQLESIRSHAAKLGVVITKEFVDIAITGKSSEKRPQYKAMRKAIIQHDDNVTAVIVWKLDRLSRNMNDFVNIMQDFSCAYVELFSVTEDLNYTTATGKLFTNLKALLSSYYVDNLREDIMRAMQSNGKQGIYNGGTPPYGFGVKKKSNVSNDEQEAFDYGLYVNEAEAVVVRLIYQCYADGYSYGEIQEQLKIHGYLTRGGKPFSKSGIYEVLHKVIYDGTYVWNRFQTKHPDGSRRKIPKPDDQVFRIPNALPAIVDKEIFDTVKRRLADKTKGSSRGKAKEVYLLTGKAFCSSCGYALEGNSKTAHEKRYTTYRCSHRHATTFGCRAKEISRDKLEPVVLSALERFLLNDSLIPIVTAALNNRLGQDSNQRHDTQPTANFEKRLKELECERSNIINAIAQTGFDSIFADKLKELDSSITAANGLIHKQAIIEEPFEPVSEDAVRELFYHGYTNLTKQSIPALRRLIETYVQRVEVSADTIAITLKIALPADTATPYLYTEYIDRAQKKTA